MAVSVVTYEIERVSATRMVCSSARAVEATRSGEGREQKPHRRADVGIRAQIEKA